MTIDSELSCKFARDCEACEDSTGVDCCDFDRADNKKTSAFEDDGALIITKRGWRAVFSIGQDLSFREQNERMKAVLKFLKLEQFSSKCLISDRDIEIEDEANMNVCPRCGGRGLC